MTIADRTRPIATEPVEQMPEPSPAAALLVAAPQSVVALPAQPMRTTRTGNVVGFMTQCRVFAPEDEAIIEQGTVIVAYRQWCRARAEGTRDDATLDKMFDMICEKTHLKPSVIEWTEVAAPCTTI